MIKRAQAAMEFLATYGWAMLVVLIVIGALAYFGVFDALNLLPQTCAISPRFSCSDFSVDVSSAKVFVNVRNSGGKDAYVSSFTATAKDGSFRCSVNFPGTITLTSNEATGFETLPCTKPDGSPIGDTSVLLKKQKYVLEIGYADSPGGYSKQANGELFAQGEGGATTVSVGDLNDPSVLWGRYSFEGNAQDSSGNGNNGVVTGAACNVPGIAGNGCSFNDNNQYIQLPQALSQAFSVSFWFYSEDINPNDMLFWQGETQIELSGGRINARLSVPPTSYTISSAAGKTNNRWYHVALVYSGSSLKLYIDGVSEGGEVVASGSPVAGSRCGATGLSCVGRDENPPGAGYLNGVVDELRIYNRALTSEEVGLLYDSFRPTAANLNTVLGMTRGYWRFEETTITSVRDSSGPAEDGTPANIAAPFGPTTGKYGGAWKFDGGNDIVNFGDVHDVGVSDFTISAWVNIQNGYTPTSWVHPFVFKVDWNNPRRGYALAMTGSQYVANANKAQILIGCATPSSISVMSTRTINDGNWHHIVGVVKKSSNPGTITLYLDYDNNPNGQTVTRMNLPGACRTASEDNNIGLQIGNPVEATIDEAQLFNRALTDSEVNNLKTRTGIFTAP